MIPNIAQLTEANARMIRATESLFAELRRDEHTRTRNRSHTMTQPRKSYAVPNPAGDTERKVRELADKFERESITASRPSDGHVVLAAIRHAHKLMCGGDAEVTS